jgi:hypothetical protein
LDREGEITYAIERRAGRLIEARVVAMRVVEDVARLEGMLVAALKDDRTAVMCVDLRGVESLPPDVADRLIVFLAHPLPRFDRIGVLLPRESTPLSTTIARSIELSRDIRSFRQIAELLAWMSGSLDAAERGRLEEFLMEPIPRRPSVQMRAVQPAK